MTQLTLKQRLVTLALGGFLLGGMTAGAFMGSPASAQTAAPSPAAETTTKDGDDTQDPQLNGSITVDGVQYEGMSEADEAAALENLANISVDEAKTIAEADSGATATTVELDNENGSLVYSVTLDDGQEVVVDAGDGTVLLTEADDNEVDEADDNDGDEADDNDGDEVPPADLGLTIEEAQAIVEQANPGATVLEMEYEKEGGVQMYEAELDNGAEVLIDANTGAILLSAGN